MPGMLPPAVESELSSIAERMAALLQAVPPQEAVSALLALNAKISLRLEQSRAGENPARKEDPSDVGGFHPGPSEAHAGSSRSDRRSPTHFR